MSLSEIRITDVPPPLRGPCSIDFVDPNGGSIYVIGFSRSNHDYQRVQTALEETQGDIYAAFRVAAQEKNTENGHLHGSEIVV